MRATRVQIQSRAAFRAVVAGSLAALFLMGCSPAAQTDADRPPQTFDEAISAMDAIRVEQAAAVARAVAADEIVEDYADGPMPEPLIAFANGRNLALRFRYEGGTTSYMVRHVDIRDHPFMDGFRDTLGLTDFSELPQFRRYSDIGGAEVVIFMQWKRLIAEFDLLPARAGQVVFMDVGRMIFSDATHCFLPQRTMAASRTPGLFDDVQVRRLTELTLASINEVSLLVPVRCETLWPSGGGYGFQGYSIRGVQLPEDEGVYASVEAIPLRQALAELAAL